jgi:aminotransferase
MSVYHARCLDQIPPSGIRRFFDLVMTTKGVISLGVGEPDFSTPAVITGYAVEQLERGETSYTSNWGMLALREEIAAYMQRSFSVDYSSEDEILVTSGVSEGVDIVLRSILNPGDEVLIPEPSYVSYAPTVMMAGGVPVRIDTSATAFKVTVAQIDAAITDKTKVIMLSYPNNPTGAALTLNEATILADYLATKDLWIVSDEVYVELTYGQEKVSFSQFANIRDRLIVLNGFSKAFAMTGWRLGYVCAPREMMTYILKIHQYCALCAPIMSQRAALKALQSGFDAVEEMKVAFNQRRQYVFNRLTAMGFEVQEPQGALYIFPSIKKFGLSDEDFALGLLEQHKVAVVPGSAFLDQRKDFVRMCYATSMYNLKEAMNRIDLFVSSL